MTVAVCFLCTDGVVIAADSMLTPSMGGINVGHHHGRKVYLLQGNQVFAFAGDQGQAARVRTMADGSHEVPETTDHPLDYPLALTQSLIAQFHSTGIVGSIDVNAMLAFSHKDSFQCCVFEGALQPRLLDEDHYYAALGSGKMSADPFLRFVADIFCQNGRPNVRQAIFLATWVIQHVIDTNPGGVAGPIRISTLGRSEGVLTTREIEQDEIQEHQQAIESAADALRTWRDNLQSGNAAEDAPEQPSPPTSAG